MAVKIVNFSYEALPFSFFFLHYVKQTVNEHMVVTVEAFEFFASVRFP